MQEFIRKNGGVILTFSKREAVHLITLLVAQVADITMSGEHAGACPVTTTDSGKRYTFVVDLDKNLY